MRIVIAPQSLKGSLTAAQAAQAIAQGAAVVYPEADIEMIPLADGGEGTVQALVDATGGTIIEQRVTGPLGEPVHAFFGILGNRQTAVLEMAACAGLPLVPPERRDPRITTTFGVGELIRAALDQGCRHFIIGIGGSATNDGGAGMLQALGVSFLTHQKDQLARGGSALAALDSIELTGLDPRVREATFEVACDVTNPLCGPTGASAVYGPQKGATPAMVAELDAALSHYAEVIERNLGVAVRDIPGAGAAGGMGAGLLAFLHANLRPGTDIIFEAVHLNERLQAADLVITAEGRLDEQTAYGKTVAAVAQAAKSHHAPVLVLAGGLGKGYQQLYDLGIDGIAVLPNGPMTLEYAIEHADSLMREATERALRLTTLRFR